MNFFFNKLKSVCVRCSFVEGKNSKVTLKAANCKPSSSIKQHLTSLPVECQLCWQAPPSVHVCVKQWWTVAWQTAVTTGTERRGLLWKHCLIQYFRCRSRQSVHSSVCSLPPLVSWLLQERTPLHTGIYGKWTETSAAAVEPSGNSKRKKEERTRSGNVVLAAFVPHFPLFSFILLVSSVSYAYFLKKSTV